MEQESGQSTPAAAAELKPSVALKMLYGVGDSSRAGFDAVAGFVLFYYTAVLGVSGSLVGVALFIGLCADAVVDPFIGSWSDNLRSRLGRRLPLMIVAAPLMALFLGLLFSPPAGLAEPWLAAWLVVTSVAVRAFHSLFYVPYAALGAELATGYAERNSVVAYRAVFGVLTGVAVTAIAYSIYFAGEGGLQQPGRYPGFGWSAAALLLVLMVVCCAGVWRYAAALPRTPTVDTAMLTRLPGEVAEVFRNGSFRLLFFSAVIFYVAYGLNASFHSHSYVFVWRLRPETIQFIAYAFLAGIMSGIFLAPAIAKRLEKKTVVLIGLAMVVVSWTGLHLLRASGVYAPTGDAALWPLMGNVIFAGVGAGFCSIAYPSMMADAADEHEHRFGSRREALYFSGLGFASKAATGGGTLLAGVALDLMRFPQDIGRQVGAILPEGVQAQIMLYMGPGAALLALASMAIFAPYAISRRRHDVIAADLRTRRAEAGLQLGPSPVTA